MKFWLGVALLMLALSARAAGLEDARALYADGSFLEASQSAAAVGSSDGFAFAARALSVHAGMQPRAQQEALYAQCERYARRALELDAKNADGYFELGAALGLLGNLRGAAYAFTNGTATQTKTNFERALELEPRHVLALVSLGRWHAEIVSRGVGFLFGGDAGRVTVLFDRALAADPRSVFVPLEYARALLTLDETRNKARARALLEQAVKLQPRDALEQRQLASAERELAKLR
jgi:tetratricopeptide (TPR) repeat protein